MKKFYFLVLMALTSVAPALAQSSSAYRYDNFDVRGGVRVEAVETTSTLPPSAAGRPATRKGLTIIKSEAQAPETAHATEIEAIPTRRAVAAQETVPTQRAQAVQFDNSLKGFTTGDARVDSFIVESGVRNGVDPVLLYAQMHTESSFKKGAVSPKGARGLMQLMPFTAARFGVTNIFDPKQNIEGGARYMRFLLDHFNGDVALALAGYNAGEGAVLKYGRRIPPYRETQEYVRRISQRYYSMRSGDMARQARTAVTRADVATVTEVQAAPAPVPSYDRAVFAVRLPDGRLQLVTQ